MNLGVQAWLDQQDAHVAGKVRQHGWYVEYVGGGTCDVPQCQCSEGDEGPAFAYTVGLYGLRHPELLIIGVPPEVAMGVLNDLGARVKSGENLLPGQLLTFPKWQHRIVPEEVPNPEEIVFSACRYYGVIVPVLQLSYDDLQGHFPWEESYSAPALQPRPGTFRA